MSGKPVGQLKRFAQRHHLTFMAGETDHAVVDATSVWRQRGARDLAVARGLIDKYDAVMAQRQLASHPGGQARAYRLTICTIFTQHNEQAERLLFLSSQLPSELLLMVKHLRHAWQHVHTNNGYLLYPPPSTQIAEAIRPLLTDFTASVELTASGLSVVCYPDINQDDGLERLYMATGQLYDQLNL